MLKAMGLSLALFFATPSAMADADAPSGPVELVETTASDLSTTHGEAVADILLRHVDADAIARFTLGRHANRLDQSELAAYEAAFEGFLRRQLQRHSHEIAGVRIDVVRADQRSPRDAIVTTRIYQNEAGQALRWRVIERGGRWRVVDLEFAGVWLAIEQRAQINALLDRPGATIDDVIAQLG
ncbi:MAG: ABC transporter substrate-binding protein [Pseudomonadota bacterium]